LILEEHWDKVAEAGRMTIMPDQYINMKIFEEYRTIQLIESELGCGNGSA
jgi:hypothetical protein